MLIEARDDVALLDLVADISNPFDVAIHLRRNVGIVARNHRARHGKFGRHLDLFHDHDTDRNRPVILGKRRRPDRKKHRQKKPPQMSNPTHPHALAPAAASAPPGLAGSSCRAVTGFSPRRNKAGIKTTVNRWLTITPPIMTAARPR